MQQQLEAEKDSDSPKRIYNAFQLIGMSSCLDLSGFFEKEDAAERKVRFTSHHPPKELLERIENIAKQMGFLVQKKNGRVSILIFTWNFYQQIRCLTYDSIIIGFILEADSLGYCNLISYSRDALEALIRGCA